MLKYIFVIFLLFSFLQVEAQNKTYNNFIKNDIFIETPYKTTNNITCDSCLFIVELIDYSVYYFNSTLTAIELFISSLCKLINPTVWPECKIVLKYINDIFYWIEKGVYKPMTVCQKIGLCNNLTTRVY